MSPELGLREQQHRRARRYWVRLGCRKKRRPTCQEMLDPVGASEVAAPSTPGADAGHRVGALNLAAPDAPGGDTGPRGRVLEVAAPGAPGGNIRSGRGAIVRVLLPRLDQQVD